MRSRTQEAHARFINRSGRGFYEETIGDLLITNDGATIDGGWIKEDLTATVGSSTVTLTFAPSSINTLVMFFDGGLAAEVVSLVGKVATLATPVPASHQGDTTDPMLAFYKTL